MWLELYKTGKKTNKYGKGTTSTGHKRVYTHG